MVILRKNDNNWLIEAEGYLEDKSITSDFKNIPLSEYNNVPKSVINYINNKNDAKVLTIESNNSLLMQDPYIQQNKQKSIMIMPIQFKNAIQSIIYLENNLLENVFSAQRVQALEIFASQAAISLENARLYYRSTHDTLTGLANRNLLLETFPKVLSHKMDGPIAIVFCDLDYFKTINDTHGHEVGDKILIHFSEQIKACIQGGDNNLAVRLGGDEFLMLIENISSKNDVENIVKHFYTLLEKPVTINGNVIKLSSSVGISLYPQDGDNFKDLLNRADLALYQAKENGKNQYQFYNIEFEK